MGSLVFSVKKLQSSFELCLLRREPFGENIIDDHVESPQFFERHALKRLPFHEFPRLTESHSLELTDGAGNETWVRRKVIYSCFVGRFSGSRPSRQQQKPASLYSQRVLSMPMRTAVLVTNPRWLIVRR